MLMIYNYTAHVKLLLFVYLHINLSMIAAVERLRLACTSCASEGFLPQSKHMPLG